MIRNLVIAAAVLAAAYTVVPLTTGKGNGPASSEDGRVALIPVASSDEVLDMIASGKRVVFVDAREEAEFLEEHIPGAVNVTLRDAGKATADLIGDADLVVGYCVKDFRGFEVAKALKNAGLENVRTLERPGLNGWKERALPLYRQGRVSEEEALARLARCAKAGGQCKEGT
jgi:rhodanese-related sulfurtransferase